MKNEEDILELLSPIEIKIIPFLNLSINEIKKKTGLDNIALSRALKFLNNKGVIKTKIEKARIVDLATNGIYYKKNNLPERNMINLLEKNRQINIQEAKKISSLSENEFRVSIGVLKDKAFIEIKEGKIIITATKDEIVKKMPEEKLIELLPIEESKLEAEQKFALENLKKRKEIIEIKDKITTTFTLTEIGKKIAGKKISANLIEEITPNVIKNWKKTDRFRRYDLTTNAPRIYGGKKHFVNQAIEKGKKIWLEMGFKEMSGEKVVSAFWNFDALFQAQDHPAREMHDTFFLDEEATLPEKELVNEVKKAHETGVKGSGGWGYEWKEKEAKKVLLRTHTTCLSAKKLASLKNSKDKTGKYFAIGKCFRNETLDWSHGFEFNQTEGIVIDKNANFRHLLGYLKEFYKKMGFDEVKFYPSYFPYTEPSVEIYAFHKTKKVWIEIGGAGMFRPEVTAPLLGEEMPVLAWGPGFDRILMDEYKVSDLRELYENDIQKLREKKYSGISEI